MAVKSVPSRRHGRLKLGCLRPAVPIAHRLREYLKAPEALPAPPASVDYASAALPALQRMYGNDTLGDCVIACYYHNLGVWTGNEAGGTCFVATDAQVVGDYSAITGYIPGDEATDQGTDPVAALKWWSEHDAADGSRLAGAVGFDAGGVGSQGAARATLQQAVDLFEGGWLTLELPDAYINPAPQNSGFTWDVAGAPDPANGHCVGITGYDAAGVQVSTWGMTGTITWAAVARYVTEPAGGLAYFLLSPDLVARASQQAPTGLDWAQLEADFPQLAGTTTVVPVVPAPVPVPPPPPQPGPGPAPPAPPPVPVAQPDVAVYFGTNTVAVAANLRVLADEPGSRVYVQRALGRVLVSKDWTVVKLSHAADLDTSDARAAALQQALDQIAAIVGPLT